MMHELFWIGIQESEIDMTFGLFTGSITIFGSGTNNNFAFDKKYKFRYNYNIDNDMWIEFVNESAKTIVRNHPNCMFCLYYPMDALFYNEVITSRMVGVNNPIKLDLWDNKFRCREWLNNDVPTISHEIVYGEEVIRRYTHSSDNKDVVLQGEYSCGGSETFLLTQESYLSVFQNISKNKKYSISPYIKENISLNIHLVIYRDQIITFTPSVQIILVNNNIFEYKGADYILYNHIPDKIKEKVDTYSRIIGKRLQRSGYLGVCGIDYIATKDEVFFCEINPRFQSSSFLINQALYESGLNFSIQKLHIDSYFYKKCQYSIPNVKVSFSYYKATYSYENLLFLINLAKRAKEATQVICKDDNLLWDIKLEENTYLYKLIFNRNICSFTQLFTLSIHANLHINKRIVNLGIIEKNMLGLKIMLQTHGITVSHAVELYMEKHNGINYQEFDALDLILNEKYYMSVPYLTNLSEISPFSLEMIENQIWLYYCEKKLMTAMVRGTDPLSSKVSKNGILYSDFTYLGFDRLRIYHRLGCVYKQNDLSCGFCDLCNDSRVLSFDNIAEAIDAYQHNEQIRHYLIGGGSQLLTDDFTFICKIAKYLKSKNKKPIYLMSLPPVNNSIMDSLKNSGITEVAFNIEIYDREIAKKYMPGKGYIPLDFYINALKYAVRIWGNNGNVRSIFIVGLEPKESLIKGIKTICQIGVSPILSLFKPIKGTSLGYLLPPTDEEILEIVNETKLICADYNVPLGPICHYCEDNTLKISEPNN